MGPMIVTGAGGYLGRHVVRAAVAQGWEVVGIGRHRPIRVNGSWAVVDVRDEDGITRLSARLRPAAMVHAAYVQGGPDAAGTVVTGSAVVAAAAARVGARLVHVSTDLVFGGRAGHYVEDDQPAPVDEYGRLKAQAEQAVAEACPEAAVVRPSLLYSDDVAELSPIQQRVLDAVDGVAPMRFFTDEVRCPSHVADVAAAVVALCQERLAAVQGPLHLGGADALSRYELACLVARWAGRESDLVHPGRRAEVAGARAGHVVLDSRRAVRLGLPIRSAVAALGSG